MIRDDLANLGEGWKIIFKCVFVGLLWGRIRAIGFRKMGKCLRHASDNQPLKKKRAACS